MFIRVKDISTPGNRNECLLNYKYISRIETDDDGDAHVIYEGQNSTIIVSAEDYQAIKKCIRTQGLVWNEGGDV